MFHCVYSSGGKYGFAERIIDGMYVSINSVVVNFKAPAFHASIQVSAAVGVTKALFFNFPIRENIDVIKV